MKKYIAILALVALTAITQAQTITGQMVTNKYNEINAKANSLTNAPADEGKTSGGWELTLGGGGTEIKGESVFGLDISLSTNPFRARPEVWVGVAQGLYWEPTFSGSTDLFVDWSQNVWNDTLYLNLGWSVGALYDNSGTDAIWRTGPEAIFQYYTSDTAFIYAGVNYDVFSSDNNEGGFRYYFGIGISF